MCRLQIFILNLLLLMFLKGLLANTEINQPSNCKEVMRNTTNKVGIYELTVPNNPMPPFEAWCNHLGHTVIQRRRDGKENFYRNWKEYKNGFGNLHGEFWLGLERIHAITRERPHSLYIEMHYFGGEVRRASYSEFYVSSEAQGYKLNIGNYSGDAVDAMYFNNDMMFSTFDRNNNPSRDNCAERMIGGFWYNLCTLANLNGPYHQYANRFTAPGISWDVLKRESLRFVEMAIGPSGA